MMSRLSRSKATWGSTCSRRRAASRQLRAPRATQGPLRGPWGRSEATWGSTFLFFADLRDDDWNCRSPDGIRGVRLRQGTFPDSIRTTGLPRSALRLPEFGEEPHFRLPWPAADGSARP